MFAVLESWRVSPFTRAWMRRACGSGTSSAVVRKGPTGQNVSSDLPLNHWPWANCKSLAETSLTQVYPHT